MVTWLGYDTIATSAHLLRQDACVKNLRQIFWCDDNSIIIIFAFYCIFI